jgi:hypothetical protein
MRIFGKVSPLLNSTFPVLFAMHDIVKAARTDFPDIYNQWCEVDADLANLRNDPLGHSRFHLDANVDLVLRSAEKEQASCKETNGEFLMGGTVFLQISLSKMWLFSTYELLRTTCDHSLCTSDRSRSNYCGQRTCLRCKVLGLKKTLAEFRVPLAKLESSRGRSDPPPVKGHADLVLGDDNGSVGWKTRTSNSNQQIVTSRLELSDLILEELARNGSP